MTLFVLETNTSKILCVGLSKRKSCITLNLQSVVILATANVPVI